MIKVCQHCSGIDADGLKKVFPDEKIIIGCTGVCENIKGIVYGKVNGLLIKATSNQEFIDKVKTVLENKN